MSDADVVHGPIHPVEISKCAIEDGNDNSSSGLILRGCGLLEIVKAVAYDMWHIIKIDW